MVGNQSINQRLHAGIIRGRKAEHTHLIITGAGQRLGRLLTQNFQRFLTHRAVNYPRLAKTAATVAAAHNLNHGTVMHDLRKRHDLLTREGYAVHILNDALGNLGRRKICHLHLGQAALGIILRLIKFGHINTVKLTGLPQKFITAKALFAALGI